MECPKRRDRHALLVAVLDDLAAFVPGIDRFAVLVALAALENLINVCRWRVVLEKLVVLVIVRLAVEENRLM